DDTVHSHLDAADGAVIVGPAAHAELATHCGARCGHVNGHHRRLHVARRLLVVQGVHDVTGDMIVAGNQVNVALGDDVRGDRPVPNCCEVIGRVIGGAASSRVGKHE